MSRLVSFFNHYREEGWLAKLPTNRLRVRDPIANRAKRRTLLAASPMPGSPSAHEIETGEVALIPVPGVRRPCSAIQLARIGHCFVHVAGA